MDVKSNLVLFDELLKDSSLVFRQNSVDFKNFLAHPVITDGGDLGKSPLGKVTKIYCDGSTIDIDAELNFELIPEFIVKRRNKRGEIVEAELLSVSLVRILE